MTKTLAIETSSSFGSVAFSQEGKIVSQSFLEKRTHCEQLFSAIDSILVKNNCERKMLEEIVVGVGPGSFTGLRIGIASAKGVAFGLNKPLYVVSSLLALAHIAHAKTNEPIVHAAVDALRGEVFCGTFNFAGEQRVLVEERVVQPDELPEVLASHQGIVVGDAVERFSLQDQLPGNCSFVALDQNYPTAEGGLLAHYAGDSRRADDDAGPHYIRPSEAEIKFPGGNPGGSFAPR